MLNVNEAIGQRLRSIRMGLNKTIIEFAEDLEISKSMLSNMETGRSQINTGLFEKLQFMYNISLDWLIAGIGGSYRNEKGEITGDSRVAFVPFYDQKVSAGNGSELHVAEEVPSYTAGVVSDRDLVEKERNFPVLRNIISPYKSKDVRALEVDGDSMTGIHLFGGDIVFFVPKLLKGDGVYVISVFNELKVKRLQFIPSRNIIKVISENSRYEPEEYSIDSDVLRIEGKVIGWVHRHPY